MNSDSPNLSVLPDSLKFVEPVIKRFFDAFAQSDWQTMARCYHDRASFSDPVFPDLRQERIVYMWHMLLSKPVELQVTYEIIFGDERKAQVQWTAQYRHGKRLVTHEVLSTLALWDGLIVRHVDEFHFARWSRQAFGISGLLFGWSSWFQRRVQRSAQSRLDRVAGTI